MLMWKELAQTQKTDIKDMKWTQLNLQQKH